MTTTVFFVRHGSHDRLGKMLCGRMGGVRLSAAGQQEAERAAERLAGEDIAAVYASPLERTQETAAPIGRRLNLPVQTAEDLIEIDFGEWTGQPFEALRQDPLWSVWNNERAVARPPNGETMSEVQARLRRWLDGACQRHPEQRIAAVSHSDAIKAILFHALGTSPDAHHRLEIGPGSVSALAAGDWGMKVLSINEAPR